MVSIKNAIVGNRMSGLVGVDAWTSEGIAKMEKEPPRSLTVRRVIKVGSNNDVLEEMANSYDRLSDSLRTYPLGVNPMVGVQFQNGAGSKTQTSLPYKLSSAFRPPLMPLEQTLPLSRQARKTFEIQVNPSEPSASEPFYFHKPLKTALVAEGRPIAAAPKSLKEVVTAGYRITVDARKTVGHRTRLEAERVIFENPRVVVVEQETPLRFSQTANKTAHKVALLPVDNGVVLSRQTRLSEDVMAAKSSTAGVVSHRPSRFKMNELSRADPVETVKSSTAGVAVHRPSRFKMNDALRGDPVETVKSSTAGVAVHRPSRFKMNDTLRGDPVETVKSSTAGVAVHRPSRFKMNDPPRPSEYKAPQNKGQKDNLNRSDGRSMREALKTETRADVSVDSRQQQPRSEHVLEPKAAPIAVVAAVSRSGTAPVGNVPEPRSGTVDRALSQQSFLHNR
jgi:hypothetical protein